MNKKREAVLGILVIAVLFILASYLVQTNMEFFEELIGDSIWGMLIYVLLAISAIVIAPIATLPLMPVASNLWGIPTTVFLAVTGWSIGSFIAFVLARKYGVDIVKRFISLENINKIERKIPEKHVFFSVVFLRMVIPPDILSYALGLFSKIKLRTYTIATVIGLIPFAFVFAYLGTVPFYYQITALLVAILVLLIGYWIKKR